MEYKNFFAVDLGATSGRTMLGTLSENRLQQRELTRFPNPIINIHGRMYWDIFALYSEVVKALRLCAEQNIHIDSIGIDSWGVDFVCFDRNGVPLSNPHCYRDPYTQGAMEDVFQHISKRQLYAKTGIQFMDFNSIFQMYVQHRAAEESYLRASKILFIPDALSYMLTGQAVCEQTIFSTSQLQNAASGGWADAELCGLVGLSAERMGRPVLPGQPIGELTENVRHLTGLNYPVPVFAVAGHDTASAVAAVPAQDAEFAYLSCGTWSLLGVETPSPILSQQAYDMNFTNEQGVFSSTRFLKNICGLWLLSSCQSEWVDAPKDVARLIDEAMSSPSCGTIINPDDPLFASPKSMLQAIGTYCSSRGLAIPHGYAQTTRCIFESLANRYREVLDMLKTLAPTPIRRLHVIGGGSLNAPLMQLTSDAIGMPVIAGPAECTAMGNLLMQAYGLGLVSSHTELRTIVSNSIETKTYEPR
ncbi:MAG: rhamnulokinase [Bacteroidales bacterium]|nr:rhamnulokinase [Bacteroidales bacterium]